RVGGQDREGGPGLPASRSDRWRAAAGGRGRAGGDEGVAGRLPVGPEWTGCVAERSEGGMSDKARLSGEQLEELRRIDSPTIANAIETFQVRPHSTGFVGLDVQPLTPELGVMVGYAVTATLD